MRIESEQHARRPLRFKSGQKRLHRRDQRLGTGHAQRAVCRHEVALGIHDDHEFLHRPAFLFSIGQAP
jgi:hypothetical protein